jgi:5'-3' exonuclease
MDVYLVDGTYELFRHFFGVPSHVTKDGREVAATRGVLGSVLGMLEGGATHIGVATDKVIESFRNGMWAAYKTGASVDPLLMAQFPLLEEGLEAMGVAVWPMVDLEADDALAGAAKSAAAWPGIGRVYLCTPDKDMAQLVEDDRIVMLNRRTQVVMDEAGVIQKFGVPPRSIPDYLALVGDNADGYPGLPGFGARTAAALLAKYGSIEAIPGDCNAWDVGVRGSEKLAQTLANNLELALLFRDLATLRTHSPVLASPADVRWAGPREELTAFCERVEAPGLLKRATAAAMRAV